MLRGLDRARERGGVDGAGEVGEGAGDGGDRDPVDDGDLVGRKLAALWTRMPLRCRRPELRTVTRR